MLQVVSPKEPFDAGVAGSGATGGWAAKQLTESARRVALLEARRKITRAPKEVRAKVIVLRASTLESTRLLLNSGICSSTGVLGKYGMDHIYGGGRPRACEYITREYFKARAL